jgi:hypothetical protein
MSSAAPAKPKTPPTVADGKSAAPTAAVPSKPVAAAPSATAAVAATAVPSSSASVHAAAKTVTLFKPSPAKPPLPKPPVATAGAAPVSAAPTAAARPKTPPAATKPATAAPVPPLPATPTKSKAAPSTTKLRDDLFLDVYASKDAATGLSAHEWVLRNLSVSAVDFTVDFKGSTGLTLHGAEKQSLKVKAFETRPVAHVVQEIRTKAWALRWTCQYNCLPPDTADLKTVVTQGAQALDDEAKAFRAAGIDVSAPATATATATTAPHAPSTALHDIKGGGDDARYTRVLEACKAKRLAFYDVEFPPTESSIYPTDKLKANPVTPSRLNLGRDRPC